MHGRRHSPGLHCLHKLCTLQVLLTCVERFLFTLFFFSLVLAVGVIGNVLVLIVILTSKSMRSSTNLFLLNLSIADLLVLIVCCPNAMVEMYMRRVRRNCLSEIIVYSSFAGHLGDGQDHVPACPLHRAHRVSHLRPYHPRHHSWEVGNTLLIFGQGNKSFCPGKAMPFWQRWKD